MPPVNPLTTIKDTQPQIDSLEKQISGFQGNLSASPTAASSDTQPTYSDLQNESEVTKLQTQLKALQKQNLSAAWYGADTGANTSADQGGQAGVIGSALNWLQQPLYGVVKGVKGLIGDKTQATNQDFTDLFAQHGLGGPLGSALGFTADVALDPVNWMTMGTGALLPRIGVGLARGAMEGGIEGAARAGYAGLTSSLGQKAAFVAAHTPFLSTAEGSFARNLSEKAAQSYEDYKALTNTDPMRYINSPGIGRGISTGALGALAPEADKGFTLGDLIKGVMSFIPHGDSLYNSLYYSSRDWLDNNRLMDAAERNVAKTVAASKAGGPPSEAAIAASEGESLSSVKPNVEILKGVPVGQEKNAMMDYLNKTASDVSFMGSNPAGVLSANPEQNTYRILQEAAATDDLRTTLSPLADQFGSGGPTGIKWYDNAVEWGNNVKMKVGDKEIAPIKAFMDTYNSVIQGAFKPAHTILSPVTWAMNIMSALPMYMMMGGENALGFMNDYRKAYMGYAGIDPRANVVEALLGDAKGVGEDWKTARSANVRAEMENAPGTMRKSLGVGPGFFLGHHAIQDMVDKAVTEGLYTQAEAASGEAERELLAGHQELQAQMRAGNLSGQPKQSLVGKMAGFLGKRIYSPAETPSDVMSSLRSRMQEADSGGVPMEADFPKGLGNEPAGFTTRDPAVQAELLNKVDAFIKAKADSGSRPFKVFQDLMDTARAGYEHQDQAFRTAVLTQLMNHGITEQGLKVMTRFVNMRSPETQILSSYVLNGQKMYRLSMDYATEVAHEAAINYGAMPAAIRMLRSMPLVGAPFASFSYGMAVKTAQSLAYNPAFFNKVSFGLQSASGHKTPLEKEALKSKYYDWYNQPSMLRLPDAMNFFSQYPLYLNLSNALPYYSLNIFQPANRYYSSVLPNSVVQTLDHAPVMKDPLGQMLFDNFLLPTLLSNADRPMSAMGSPLYPINATTGDKAFYAGRGLVDALTPAVVAPAGLLAPSDYAKYYPGYRTRQMSYGKAGESALGIPGAETASSRAIRNILGYLGLPVEQLDTTYANTQVNAGKAP